MSPLSEADILYRTLFGRPAPELIVQRFAAFSEQLDQRSSAAELSAYRRALAHGGNLEALEYAARLTGRLPLLTRKLQAMTALAETLPENQSAYINTHSSWAQGAAALAWAGLRTVGLAAQGLWELRRGCYA